MENMYPAICFTFQICCSWTPKAVLAEEQFAEHLKEYTEQFQGTKQSLGGRNCWQESEIDPDRSHTHTHAHVISLYVDLDLVYLVASPKGKSRGNIGTLG